METIQFQENSIEIEHDQKLFTLKNEDEVKLISLPNSSSLEDEAVRPDVDLLHDHFEGTSYHELRCLSNEDLNDSMTHFLPVDCKEYEELITMKQQPALEHSYCKFYRTFSENCFSDSIENTDDQLFIEIVKEEIDLSTDPDEETSIFDSISFNIEDEEDSMTQYKIIDAENRFSVDEPSKYAFFKKPQDILPETTQMESMKEKRNRKPMGLANYRSLITEAINSSTEKRMILTDIYKWILAHVPSFKEDDDGWKNCVRHTLSVNERFMRIRNKANCRSSYWTVCEEGEFDTKIASFPWASEIFKPEERKRSKSKINHVNVTVKNKDHSKHFPNIQGKEVIGDRIEMPNIKKRTGLPVSLRKIEDPKPRLKIIERKKKLLTKTESEGRQALNTDSTRSKRQPKGVQSIDRSSKNSSNKQHRTKITVKNKISSKLLKRKKNCKTATKKHPFTKSKTTKTEVKNQAETVRRSGRKKATRKIWKI